MNVIGNELKALIQKNIKTFEIEKLLNVDESQLQQKIAEYTAQGMLVNVISGGEKEIESLQRTLTYTPSSKRLVPLFLFSYKQ